MNTAVILTARKERDAETPYPLQPFEGNLCLIDRTLAILRSQGYGHIVIVTGYRHELFEKYKADDVTLLKNDNYQFTASMGSLAIARETINEDFLLVEGDTFYETKVIEQLSATSHRNCLAITEESGSGDEAFVETCEGFVTKVSKDRHQICSFEGELLGICKISLDTYRRMLAKWDSSNNPLLNYEYVLMDCTTPLERPCIMFKNLIWGDVDNRQNFDKLRSYIYPRLRRKENPFDHDNIVAYMETIFSDEKDVRERLQVEQIGGMSNKNFKVSLSGNDYVLRIPGIGSEGMVVRTYEEQNSLLASQMGINPAIRYFNSTTGIKLADYIRGAETLNSATIQRSSNLRKIARIYRTLHSSSVRFNNDFNVFHEIRQYEGLMLQAGAQMYEGYGDVRESVFGLEQRLNALGIQLKPCHNDAVPENFIKAEDGTLYLIDWEYSGMNDPLWEFAALFIESDFTEDNQAYFLNQYYDDEIPVHTQEKILIYQILMDVLWAIWTVVKEAKGDDFGTYGQDRFRRAFSNMQKLNEQYK